MIVAPSRTILLIENNAGDARLLREMLREHHSADTELTHVQTLEEAKAQLALHSFEIVLLDLGLSDSDGLESVRRAHAAAPNSALVVLTGREDEDFAARALKYGAQDYLIKGQIDARGLRRSLRYAIERYAMEAVLFDEKERAQVTLNCIGDGVACTDSAGNVTFLNVVAEKLAGWEFKDAEGKPVAKVLHFLDAASREVTADLTQTKPLDAHFPINSVLVSRSGFETAVDGSIAPIRDRSGRVMGAVIVFRDVGAARATQQEIAHSAQHDYLTGLPNRILFRDRAGQAIALAARNNKKAAVLFLDLDGFKSINDTLGHAVGDKLLQSVATRLLECTRVVDTVSRQGGDEFVVLLSELDDPQDAAIAAKRMLEHIASPHPIDQQGLSVTTSIGVSVYPEDGRDPEMLIQNADTAMYQAKKNGRQRFQFFERAMNARAERRQSMEEDLRRAWERQELVLHYQPRIDLTTGAIVGAEALLRWTGSSIPPAIFIPLAETCGLIVPMGKWVLREACKQARAWVDAKLQRAAVAVNVSAAELRGQSFLPHLLAVLSETGLDPALLQLEMTESALSQGAGVVPTLQILRDHGVRLTIDNFGTGYSSLGHLRRFPIDILKIDHAFIRQISNRGEDAAFVAAVIAMGRSLKLSVVAEGVETLEELQFLQAHQCHEAQGYYFSRPIPAPNFAQLLKKGSASPLGFSALEASPACGDFLRI